MKRSTPCRTCGATIKPTAKDMSLQAAVRKHYWRHHPEVMMGGRAASEWSKPRSRR